MAGPDARRRRCERWRLVWPRLLLAGLLLSTAALGPATPARAEPTLRIRVGSEWRTWWRASDRRFTWTGADAALARALAWREVRDGMETAALHLSAEGEASRLRVVLVRWTPERFTYALRRGPGYRQARWTAEDIPAGAALAFNVGQFRGDTPWGWLVDAGRERQPRGQGSLATAVILDHGGGAMLVAERDSARLLDAPVAVGFQSFPTLLMRGEIPAELRTDGRGVDLGHRDSRLALGILPDGRLLVALTRFDGLNGAVDELPVGLTVPEMAALMGGLGAADAVMLDGGISGQLAIRDRQGDVTVMRGWRRVPVGLVLTPR